MLILPDELVHKHKYEKDALMELKGANGSEGTLAAFQKVEKELTKEGSYYSINRESFIRFFNELSEGQQKELLTMVSSAENEGKNIYDVAQEYNARLLQAKP